jgi:hypothetical protein
MQLGENNPRENTNAGNDRPQVFTIGTPPDGGGNQVVLQIDAPNKRLTFGQIDTTGNFILTNMGQVVLDLAACLGSDGNYHKVYLQEITVYDGSCVPHKAIALISDFY